MRSEFEKLPEIARMVSCDEVKWCDVYNWYRTDNTDASSIYHIAWLNGAWYAFQEQQNKCDELQVRIDAIKSHSLMLRDASKSWAYNEREKNILISQADDLDRILKGEENA